MVGAGSAEVASPGFGVAVLENGGAGDGADAGAEGALREAEGPDGAMCPAGAVKVADAPEEAGVVGSDLARTMLVTEDDFAAALYLVRGFPAAQQVPKSSTMFLEPT